jgi:hypothetical protein
MSSHMVFWSTYPILNIFLSKVNKSIFRPLLVEKTTTELSKELKTITINGDEDNNKLVSEIRLFLKNNFGRPPKKPTLDIPEDKLLGEKDHIIVVKDLDKKIIGCVRYHYLGKYLTSNNEEIYCVDCFCINSKWRNKGIGDYLLAYLNIYVNKCEIPFSVFLKEGKSLSILHSAFYSSSYVYRKLFHQQCDNVKSLSIKEAYDMIDIFLKLNPSLFVVRNQYSHNQKWVIFKKDIHIILACIQDTYQIIEEEGIQKIGWITAWFESPAITDSIRKEAAIEISATAYPYFTYLWLNKEWIGNNRIWLDDGPFHWYLYQWITSANIKKSYCLLN